MEGDDEFLSARKDNTPRDFRIRKVGVVQLGISAREYVMVC
jgi:hypothetical protein